jgi:hypothetical protein
LSPEPSELDEELTALLHSKLEHVYGPVVTEVHSPSAKQNPETIGHVSPAPKPNDGFEFRLFAGSRSTQAVPSSGPDVTAPRIILNGEHDAGDLSQQGGFVVPRREGGYYFTGAATRERKEERRREFEIAAVSGEEVRRWLGVRYWGWEVRWRARVLRDGKLVVAEDNSQVDVAIPLTAGLDLDGHSETGLGSGRKNGKPGKKRRIILRMRRKKGEEASKRRREEAEWKNREEKEREEAEREKRTRRNREKKVKKKMREREKKRNDEGNDLGNAQDDENREVE